MASSQFLLHVCNQWIQGGPSQELDEENQKLLQDLDDLRPLTLDVLAATWPHEYEPGSDDEETASTPQDDTAHLDEDRPESTEAIAAADTARDTTVDLSNNCLSPAEILATLTQAGQFSRLNISHNPSVNKAVLTDILATHNLEWINIDGCDVSDEDITDLLITQPSLFRGTEVIIHPAFLSAKCLEGNAKDIPSAFRVMYGSFYQFILPFFGTDQLVQNLLDLARAHSKVTIPGPPPAFRSIQSLLSASYRSGRPWAERGMQTIPLQTTSQAFGDGYTLLFFPQTWKNSIRSPHGGFLYNYGIVTPSAPGSERKFIDIAGFLECLEKDGWPTPKDKKAVGQVIKAYGEWGVLLEDVGLTMEELRASKQVLWF